jgi:hypothetical protein
VRSPSAFPLPKKYAYFFADPERAPAGRRRVLATSWISFRLFRLRARDVLLVAGRAVFAAPFVCRRDAVVLLALPDVFLFAIKSIAPS